MFCPSPLCCRRHIGKREDPADKVGHFMWTYIETLRRCRSDFDFKLVSSKISFLVARLEGLILMLQSDLNGVDFRSQIRGDITGRTSKVRN